MRAQLHGYSSVQRRHARSRRCVRFIETAPKLGVDESGIDFEAAMKILTRADLRNRTDHQGHFLHKRLCGIKSILRFFLSVFLYRMRSLGSECRIHAMQ
jgi:hypothetical protein